MRRLGLSYISHPPEAPPPLAQRSEPSSDEAFSRSWFDVSVSCCAHLATLRLMRCAVIIAATATASCSLGDGFRDVSETLFDGEKTRFDREATRLMKGSYRRAALVASQYEEPHLVVITDEDDPHALIQGRSDEEPCDAGQADEFEQLTSFNSPLVVRTQTHADAEGQRTFRFIDTDCKEVMPAIEEAIVVDRSCTAERCVDTYMQSDRTLVFIDVGEIKRLDEVENVIDYQTDEYFTRILQKNGNLSSLASGNPDDVRIVAESVESFALGAAIGEVVIQTSEGVFFRGLEKQVINDACLLTPEGSPAFHQVVETPCASGHRFLMNVDWATGELYQHPVPEDLGPIVEISQLYGREALIAISLEPGADERDYYTLADFRVTEPGADLPTFEPLAQSARRLTDRFGETHLVLSEYDGQAGTLSRLQINAEEPHYELIPLLDDVHRMGTSIYCPQYLVETAPKDGLVDLDCLDHTTGEQNNLVQRVAPLNEPSKFLGVDTLGSWFASSRRRTSQSFVTQVEAGRGSLQVLEFEDRRVVAHHQPKAKDIWSGSSTMSQEPHAALYVKGDDQELWSYYPELDETRKIATSVKQYVLLTLPTPGIIYIVEEGPDEGIWLLGSK